MNHNHIAVLHSLKAVSTDMPLQASLGFVRSFWLLNFTSFWWLFCCSLATSWMTVTVLCWSNVLTHSHSRRSWTATIDQSDTFHSLFCLGLQLVVYP